MPSLRESPVKGDGIYEITFNRNGTLSVTADANRATGTCERKGYDQISISVETSTLALGPPESLGESFLASLGEVTGFAFDSRRLALIFPKSGNESFLMFEAAE